MLIARQSLTGHVSRYSVLEKMRNFDRTYLKRLLVKKDAVDILALRLQDITIDEHYARLYGPSVIVHERMRQRNSQPATAAPYTHTEAERQLLKRALSNTPFELLRHNAYVRHSKEHVQNWLKQSHEDKMRQLEHRLILVRLQRQSQERNAEAAEGEATPDGIAMEKNKLLWQKAGLLSAMHIKRRYEDAKGEFKGRRMSVPLRQDQEQETKF